MELITYAVLFLSVLILVTLVINVKRLFIDKDKSSKNRKDFVMGIVFALMVGLMWIIIPASTEIIPITINDDVITTVETSTKQFIVSGPDTLFLSIKTIVDTLSVEMVSDTMELNKEIKYTIFGEAFSRKIIKRDGE